MGRRDKHRRTNFAHIRRHHLDTLAEIADICRLSTEDLIDYIATIPGLTREAIDALSQLKQDRLAEISSRVIPMCIETPPTPSYSSPEGGYEAIETAIPEYIYSYATNTNILYRTRLATGTDSCIQLGHFQFAFGCILAEGPGKSIHITGGTDLMRTSSNAFARIDTTREFSVVRGPPMITARIMHCAIYHREFLYVLGGFNLCDLNVCERYAFGEQRWSALESLPQFCSNMSAIVLEETQCLYGLGGAVSDCCMIRTLQRLSLTTLLWDLMDLKLPAIDAGIACFKTDETKAYFLIDYGLYVFHPRSNTIRLVKLSHCISSDAGPSYYSKGIVYSSEGYGEPTRLEIGSLV